MPILSVRNRNIIDRTILILMIVIGLLIALFPFIWMVSSSLKFQKEIFRFPVTYIPDKPTLVNYTTMWKDQPLLWRFYLNSIFVSTVATVISVIISALAGYGFSRYNFRYKNAFLLIILMSQMFPHILITIPYFIWMSRLGLLNTYAALILSYVAFSLPFCIWMIKGFFDSIPNELEQAAKIDGCNSLSAFMKIIVPLSSPGIGATALFSFMVAWNHFLFSLVLVSSNKMYTITVGINHFIGSFDVQWGQLNAAAVLATFPILVLFFFLEKYMVSGLTAGAVKG